LNFGDLPVRASVAFRVDLRSRGFMIEAADFLAALDAEGCGPYIGVPCSFLTPFIDTAIASPSHEYLAASNEGEAVAIAAGAYFAGHTPVVMFQNSGLSNALSPLTSLAWPFRLPLLLITTHRGAPGLKDEPQHELMGEITEPMLRLAQIGCGPFPRERKQIPAFVRQAVAHGRQTSLPWAWIMAHGSVAESSGNGEGPSTHKISSARHPRGEALAGEDPDTPPVLARAQAIAAVADALPSEAALIATTGKIGRELFTLKERAGNFYVVGSMGCASSIGLGVARYRPGGGTVVVLDGDGAALMRLEAFAAIGRYAPRNLIHVILDNRMHESTGGQESLSGSVRFDWLALSCGYASAESLVSQAALEAALRRAQDTPGPHLVHVRVLPGSLQNLGRPALTPVQVKERFINFLASGLN
jgi:phosphonopyruvate decarboxylase